MDENRTFGDALEAARASFGTEQEMPVQEVTTEPTPEQQVSEPEAPMSTEQALDAEVQVADEAIATAQQAAQIAQQKDAEVNQLKQMLEQERQHSQEERQRSQNLAETLSEMNKQRETEVLAEALVPPQIDLKTIMFEDDEAIAQAQAKYAEDMAAYNRKLLEKEYEPIKEQARRLEEHDILERMKSDLKGREDFEGFDSPEMQKRMRNIIEQNAFLKNSDLPIADKYINAYAIARGADAMYAPKPVPEQPKAPTVDELMAIYAENPDFRAAIEKKRIEELSHGQQVPPLTASSGAGNVALNIKEKPQTLGEARERAKNWFNH